MRVVKSKEDTHAMLYAAAASWDALSIPSSAESECDSGSESGSESGSDSGSAKVQEPLDRAALRAAYRYDNILRKRRKPYVYDNDDVLECESD